MFIYCTIKKMACLRKNLKFLLPKDLDSSCESLMTNVTSTAKAIEIPSNRYYDSKSFISFILRKSMLIVAFCILFLLSLWRGSTQKITEFISKKNYPSDQESQIHFWICFFELKKSCYSQLLRKTKTRAFRVGHQRCNTKHNNQLFQPKTRQ